MHLGRRKAFWQLFLAIGLLGSFIQIADAQDVRPNQRGSSLADIKLRYPSIFVAKILSSESVNSSKGEPCYFAYTAEVVEQIRGKFSDHRFRFATESGLVTGDQYLIFSSGTRDSYLRRNYDDCPKLPPYFFLYSELNHIDVTFFDVNSRVDVPVVSFSADVDVPLSLVHDRVDHVIELKRVRNWLKD